MMFGNPSLLAMGGCQSSYELITDDLGQIIAVKLPEDRVEGRSLSLGE